MPSRPRSLSAIFPVIANDRCGYAGMIREWWRMRRPGADGRAQLAAVYAPSSRGSCLRRSCLRASRCGSGCSGDRQA